MLFVKVFLCFFLLVFQIYLQKMNSQRALALPLIFLCFVFHDEFLLDDLLVADVHVVEFDLDQLVLSSLHVHDEVSL